MNEQWSAYHLAIVFGGLVVMWVIQMYFTWLQSQRFMTSVRTLRTQGTVAIGVGGRRYRGGRAFVALAHKDSPTVVGALTLSGFTVLSTPKELPALVGMDLGVLANGGAPNSLKPKFREAAAMAAKTLTSGALTAVSDITADNRDAEESRQEGTLS